MGTNNENSDIDVRGVTLNRKSDLIGMTSYDQYTDENTDTVIYTFNKIIRLLLECNPNTCELLGLNEEHYLYLSPIGEGTACQPPFIPFKGRSSPSADTRTSS